MSESLFSAIRSAMPSADKIFMRTESVSALTYGDALDLSGRLANVFTSLGVKPGDRIAAQVEKSPEALIGYLACLRAGAVYLPLNTAYTGSELAYFLSDAEPSLFISTPDRGAEAEKIRAEVGVAYHETLGETGDGTLLEKAAASDIEFADVARSSDDLAALLYTSGTTGRSKGAMLSHGNLLSNARALAETWRYSADDVLLHALPIFHTHGLFVAVNITLISGASIILLPRFDLDEMIAQMPNATVMMGVPTFYIRLLTRDDFTGELTKGIRLFVAGSAPLSAETHREFEQRTGHAILERYGMSETNMNTSNPYDGNRRAGTVGFPLPGVEVRVTGRESGETLPDGEAGMIEVRGPNVFSGYWRMPDKTKEEFREDGFFITGDLGLIDDQGYVAIVGRDKDLIISGGYNVYPAEIENELDAVRGVAESAVIGVPHKDFGEGVTAVVVCQPNADLSEKGVRQTLGENLANYKVPKRVIFLDALPRNAMGKIEKKVLRERYADLYQ